MEFFAEHLYYTNRVHACQERRTTVYADRAYTPCKNKRASVNNSSHFIANF